MSYVLLIVFVSQLVIIRSALHDGTHPHLALRQLDRESWHPMEVVQCRQGLSPTKYDQLQRGRGVQKHRKL